MEKSTQPKKDTSKTAKIVAITPDKLDPSKLVLDPPVTQKFVVKKQDIEVTKSTIHYLNEQGDLCNLYLILPPQHCWGVSYVQELETDKGKGKNFNTNNNQDKDPEEERANAKGLQVCYPMTSLQTLKKPLAEEAASMKALDVIWKFVFDESVKLCAEEEKTKANSLPGVTLNAFAAAEKRGPDSALKRLFEYRKTKDTKKPDATKPQQMYAKLVTSGTGESLKCQTIFYGPGNRKINPLRCISVKGILEPLLHIKEVYYGGHGKNPHGASLRCVVAQANFTKQDAEAVPQTCLLPSNNAPVPAGDSSDDDDEENVLPRGISKADKTNQSSGFVPLKNEDAGSTTEVSEKVNKLAVSSSNKVEIQKLQNNIIKKESAPKKVAPAAAKGGGTKPAPLAAKAAAKGVAAAKAPAKGKPKAVAKVVTPPPKEEESEEEVEPDEE